MLTWTDYVKILVSIVVILDPPGVVPLFLSATADQTPTQRRRTAGVTASAVAVLLIGAALAGEWVLQAMGIRIATFRVGGGILLLLTAVSMMHATVSGAVQTPEEAREARVKEDVAVVPLAIPLLAGPGALSTVLIYTHKTPGFLHKLLLCGIILAAALAVWGTLRLGDVLGRLLGRTGINVLTRLMGLLLVAVAVEFIVNGLLELFPGLR